MSPISPTSPLEFDKLVAYPPGGKKFHLITDGDAPSYVKKKTVRFNLRCKVRPIPNLDCFSNKIKSNSWYSKEELRSIKEECKLTARVVLRKGDGDYQVCTRGLERFFPKTAQRRERRTLDLREVVLEEQAYQRLFNLHDSEFISELCVDLNKCSCRDALLQAGSDEQYHNHRF